mmetsp:Transcript_16824/g.22614  ORF Transcript_16824/g.22614 Transcript_16824/m.22614 type:complete len:732 (-) Transcript_16824:417-2612(-)|eukprot:CAMPEP_0185744242 /NCGR_PEP_ID=MMETSP1174-20130828/2274_1 /TAXON_ID=35687 /ORGANISM="Dictyocha speculum, Strain CCMP1381" /LENGTH=731 /DNA_ID=CAMNT_0028417497 /DNA_START=158 /DNA_END=2353 /DNA_ORIENTATION=-
MSKKEKFVIKPFRPHCQMDNNQAQEIWQDLSLAIHEIHNQNASSLSFEELYRNAYNLVLHKHGELLYNGVCECVQNHLSEVAEVVAATPDEQLLGAIAKCWDAHQNTMMMVRDILMYMDRTYVTQNKKTPVYDLGLIIFRDSVARHEQVQDRLKHILLANIAAERAGQLIERMLMRNTLSMFAALGVDGPSVYEEDFEHYFLDTTRNFYRTESLEYISQNTCPDYLTKAESRINEESERVKHFLHPSTEPKLKQIIETELIYNHAKTLVDMENSGCVPMLRDDKVEDLKRMYELFSRVPTTLDWLRDCMCRYVKKVGRELVSDQERVKEPVQFVKGLLNMREKYDRLVTVAFNCEKKAQKKLKDAFEEFINADARCASYLVLYTDELLKSALRGLSESEADSQLDKVIVIFRYLQDKDIFENFYKQYLGKRLLSGRSVSEDAERNMIAKLKTECGYQFTSKLEGMFTDMTISKEAMEQYTRAGRQESHRIELEVNVLTAGYWPTQSVPSCRLPTDLDPVHASFQSFYLSKHTGRKLAWQTHMGTADLKARFGSNRHDLNVTTYQMCILMLFNRRDAITLEDMRELSIPDPELKRHLISLCTPKYRILKKSHKGKLIAEDEVFTFNESFTSKLKRVKIPLVSAKEGNAARAAGLIPAPVEEDRRHLVEASIVRIMKARKTMRHNDLIAEVTRQLSSRFVPEPAFIKKRIESLIEREYLERDRDDRRTYKYLA